MSRSRRRAALGLGVFVGFGLAAIAAGPAAADPVPLQRIGSGDCYTYAPPGWHIIEQNPRGPILTLGSPDGLMAGYAGTAISGAQLSGAYGPQFRSPETFIGYAIQSSTHEPTRQTAATQPMGPYHLVHYASASRASYALYYTSSLRGVDPNPAAYALLMRIGIGFAGNQHSVAVAGAVAEATRCVGGLQPPAGGYGQYEAPKSQPRRPGGASGRDNDATMNGTYNAQLGTAWAHDGAGRNYHIDTSSDYRANGPDGPGYYAKQGNQLYKLTPGLQ